MSREKEVKVVSDDRVSIEDIVGLKASEKLRKKLVKEELKKRAKQPVHWAKAVFRVKAIKWALFYSDLSPEEKRKLANKYYEERRKEREKILRRYFDDGRDGKVG
ncbi:MAG: hypothetical protein ACTSV7_14980 [Candidatus Baldrarchaeia archaeon]